MAVGQLLAGALFDEPIRNSIHLPGHDVKKYQHYCWK